MRKRGRIATALLFGTACASLPGIATAQDLPIYSFNLPQQDLGDALRSVAQKAGWELYANAKEVNGIKAPAIQGNLTARDAIIRLLEGTALHATFSNGVVKIRGRSDASGGEPDETSEILVTGSRIVGAPPSAPVTVISDEDIRNAGQTDLGQVARSLPMNFGGGQNPGIGLGQGTGNAENVNVNGSSTFNLRGIGTNATLTLLNGNRVGNTGATSAVDVSAIPAAAVQRIEIIADGASAIYGSDAVAGVVNIILKPDYDGLWTSARIGSSTDGGDFEQGFSAVAGSKWSSGGIMAAYDFDHSSAIRADQRSYTSSMNPAATIYPSFSRHDALITAHQDLTPGIELTTDLTYKIGHQQTVVGYTAAQPITYSGAITTRNFNSFGATPTLKFKLPKSWTGKISGYYGEDKTSGPSNIYSPTRTYLTQSYFKNSAWSLEGSAQGPLFALPAGSVRLAIGGGIRQNQFAATLSGPFVDVRRTNHFAYAEAFAPIIAPRQKIQLIYQASLTAAVRVEDYSDSARIATPKIGLNLSPFKELELKASWGKSYKVPSLFQQYGTYSTVLYSASKYGYAANSTYISASGSNPVETAEH